MEAGNWIALGAVAAGLAGTAIANRVTWNLGVRRFDHERTIADRDAVGVILEEAAVEIHEFSYALDDLRVGLITEPVGYFLTGPGLETFGRLRESGQALDARAERLQIRLAGDLTAKAFSELNDTALAMFRTAALIKGEVQDVLDDRTARESVKSWVTDQRDQLITLREQFDDRRRVFKRASFRAVGVASSGRD